MTGTRTKSIAADDKGMSIEEVRRFEQLDGRIERGVRSFVEVGQALAEVRDCKLYRKDFGSFEAYCESKGISKRRAYQFIESVGVAENVNHGSRISPTLTSERQARELAKLPADEQADAFIEASERTGGRPTAAAIKQVVAERKAPTTTFGEINTDDEPTAVDADERDRKADAKQFVNDAPGKALAEAQKAGPAKDDPILSLIQDIYDLAHRSSLEVSFVALRNAVKQLRHLYLAKHRPSAGKDAA